MNQLILAVVALSLACVRAQYSGDDGTDADARNRSIWKGTSMDNVVQQCQQKCVQQPDSSACVEVKVLNLVDEVLGGNTYKDADSFSMIPNENDGKETMAAESGRNSEVDVLEHLENYIKSRDVVARFPVAFLQGMAVKFSSRNLDQNELNLSIALPSDDENTVSDEGRGRKNKLKKILAPILVFVLLKAMTLIPLAIGVLILKAWNALQLSFISFVVSSSLAMFQFFKKIATDSTPSPIATHIPFDASHYVAARNFAITPEQKQVFDVPSNIQAQNMAYNAHVQS